MSTKIFYKDVKMIDGSPTEVETELEFIQWTPRFLLVKYPVDSIRAGRTWRMGRSLVNAWLRINRLRIEGDVPDWALVI